MAINLGDINFGLGPDTKRLDEARKKILEFGQAVNRAAKSTVDGAREQEAALRKQEKAVLSALQNTLKLNESIRATAGTEKYLNSTTAGFNRLVKEITNGRATQLEFQRAQEDFQATVGRVSRAVNAQKLSIQANEKAQREAIKAQKEAEKAQRDQAKVAFDAARAQEQAILRTENAYFKATAAVERMTNAVERLKKAPANIQALPARAQTALQSYQQSYANAGGSNILQQRSNQAFQQEMAKLNAELTKFRSNAKELQQTNLEATMRRITDAAILMQGPMSGVATRLSLISSLSSSTGLAVAGLVTGLSAGAFAFVQLGKGAIEAGRIFDKLNNSFNGLYASTSLTSTELNYVMQVADRAGTQFDTTAQQFLRLSSAAKGTALEGEATRKIFESITFAAQKLGSSNEELTGTLRAVEQIISKGTVQAEELRGQLGDRLPGAVQIMAQALGVTTQELDKMMKQGQITSNVLLKFADEVAKRYGVDVTKSINTVTAAEGRLYNAYLRMNKTLDETIGFSSAYKNSLNAIANGMDGFTNNLDTVAKTIGAVTGAIVGAIAAIYAPTIIAGLGTVLAAIKQLGAAMVAFNFATMSNPLGALATVLIRLTAAAAGAFAGYELLSRAVGDTGTAHQKAVSGVKEYIQAQTNLKSSIRSTTQEFINQQEIFLKGTETQINDLINKREEAQKKLSTLPTYTTTPGFGIEGFFTPLEDPVATQLNEQIADYSNRIKTLQTSSADAKKDLEALYDIMRRQNAEEEKRSKLQKDPLGAGNDEKGLLRKQLATKNALDTIREMEQSLAVFELPQGMREWARIQVDINKSVENFRDQLTKAKVPIQEVDALTLKYKDTLTQLKETEFNDPLKIDAWTNSLQIIGNGLDSVGSSIADMITEGKMGFEDLADVGKQVANDLINSFMQLALLNPLKNLLMGGNPATGMPFPTLSFSAKGNAFNNGTLVPFAKGGVTNGPEYFPMSGNRTGVRGEAGKEGVFPLRRTSSGKLGVEAVGGGGGVQNNTYIINESGGRASIRETGSSRNSTGGMDKQIIVEMVESIVVDQFNRGSSRISKAVENNFQGVRRSRY